MKELRDPLLEELLKEIPMEKPSSDFKSNVMALIPETTEIIEDENRTIISLSTFLFALFSLAFVVLFFVAQRIGLFDFPSLQEIQLIDYLSYAINKLQSFRLYVENIHISSISVIIIFASIAVFLTERSLRRKYINQSIKKYSL